jgi:hypothetical protein
MLDVYHGRERTEPTVADAVKASQSSIPEL